MRLWLMRHGQAEAHALAKSDISRSLTIHGRDEVSRIARHLRDAPLDTILASPYVRAQQTAEHVRQILGLNRHIETVDWLTPDTSPAKTIAQLDRYNDQHILLVSHQPLLGRLGGILAFGDPQTPLPMTTASLAQLDGEFPFQGMMNLIVLHQPERD